MTSVVGVDIAKSLFDVATPLPSGKHRTRSKLANTLVGFKELEGWLEKHVEPGAVIVMEATGTYHEALAEHLYHLGYRVSVVNPAVIYHYRKSEMTRVKTDKVDAKLIADFANSKHEKPLRAWKPEPTARRRLRALLRRLDDLQEMLQMERNRLEVSDSRVQASIRSVISHLEHQIKETQRAIKQHIDDDPELRGKRDLMVTIDGIGEKTAAIILAEFGDPLDYDGPRAMVAFAGLNPQLADSGKFSGRSVISKTGPSRIRAAMYLPCVTAIKYNPAMAAMSVRLKANGKVGKQIVCAVMRKMLHIIYGVLKSGQPFDPKLAVAR
ncbi:MAG: IS110 family transposase [Pyrinomonadaceae bacterium]